MGHGNSGIIQSSIDRIFIVPMIETSVVSNVTETAQWRYDNIYRYTLCGTSQEWNARYNANIYDKPPLCLFINEVLFKNKYNVKIHFLGLDPITQLITPWISDKPPGYFAGRECVATSAWATYRAYKVHQLVVYASKVWRCLQCHFSVNENDFSAGVWEDTGIVSGATNPNGWDTENEFLTRLNDETAEILGSEYFATHMDDTLIYNKNVPNKLDMVLMCPPHYCVPKAYPTTQARSQAKTRTISIPSIPAATEAQVEPVDHEYGTIIHEHLHLAYWGLMADGVFGRDDVSREMPDMYVERGEYAPSPISNYPVSYSCYEANHGYQISPMMSKLMGIIEEGREITESGEYELGLRSETFDCIIIRCPADKYTYCILSYEKFDPYQSYPSHYGSYWATTGVNAYFIRMYHDRYSNKYTFSNVSGMPYGAYASFELTYQCGYKDLDNEIYDGARLKRRSLLLDFQTYSGITVSYAGTGVRENGVPYAAISIELDPPQWNVPEFAVTPTLTGGGGIRLTLDSYYLANADSMGYRWSTNPDMSGGHYVSAHTFYNDKLASNKNEAHHCPLPLGVNRALRYVRLEAFGDNGTVCSNIVSREAEILNWISDPSINVTLGVHEILLRVGTGWTVFDPKVCGVVISIEHEGDLINEISTDIIERYGDYEYSIENLSPDTEYTITVKYNWADVFSNVVTGEYATLDYIPGEITITSAYATGSDRIDVTHNYLDEADEYEISLVCGENVTTEVKSADDYVGGSIAVDCPYPGQEVSITVRGKADTYYSSQSEAYELTMPEISPPAIYEYALDGQVNATIMWHVPANTEDATYIAEASDDEFVTILDTVSTGFLTALFEFLPGKTQIWVRCKAVKHGRESAWSGAITFITDEMDDPQILSIIPSYEGIRIKHTVEPAGEYVIEIATDSNFINPETYETDEDDYDLDGYASLSGLHLNRAYYCRVRRSSNEHGWSLQQGFATLPLPAPTGVQLSFSGEDGEGVIAAVWDESPVTGVSYAISISASPDMAGSVKHILGEVSEADIDAESYRQTGAYMIIGAVKSGETSQTEIMYIYVPAAYDQPHIYVIEPKMETVKLRHYKFNDAASYHIEVGDTEKELVYELYAQDGDYDKSGYIELPGYPLMSGTYYVLRVTAMDADNNPISKYTPTSEIFQTTYLYTPSAINIVDITDSACVATIIYGGGITGEIVRIELSKSSGMETIVKTYDVDFASKRADSYYEMTGLEPGTRYYAQMQSYKAYGDIIKYSYAKSYFHFQTYYPNNRNKSNGGYVANIINAKAEKKTRDIVLVTWEVAPYNANSPYRILRSITGYGDYKPIGEGLGNAFIDDIRGCSDNENIGYIIESVNATAGVQLGVQADNWLLCVASDYLWQLENTYSSTRAVAYCLGKNNDNCPECYSETLGKRIKSECTTCDGSGKMTSYVGPIPFKFSPLQINKDMANMGNAETEREYITAWTANIPLFNIGDIVITDTHVKYVVQAIPNRSILHSTVGNKEFIAKQTITMRRLKDNEYTAMNYYGKAMDA